MSRILVAARSNSSLWAQLLRAELPDHSVIEAIADGDREPVSYLVVGKPQAGFISGVPGIKLVLSVNAGIEHLLAGGEVPPSVPIVRLVDPTLAEGMAEWVMAHVLAWHRDLKHYERQHSEAVWKTHPVKLARERTVTVLGAGALGGLVSEHLVRFGFLTRVWNRGGSAIPGARSFKGKEELEAAVSDAEILINLLPLTWETQNLIDAGLLARLAPGALLINGARGGHVVDDDLLAAIESGRLGGAALDVFRTEPLPPDHRFWRHPKIVVSPHVSAPTHPRTAVAVMAETIRCYERGEPIANVVDRARGY